MNRALLSTGLFFVLAAMPGLGQAMTVLIDFDNPLAATGDYDPGDNVVTVSGLTVSIAQGSVGNPRNGGTILNPGSAIGGGFSGNYFSSVSTETGQNDGRLDLAFSIPIVGTVTLDANYLDTTAIDFQVIDLLTGTQVHTETDGPNTKFVSFTLTTPTTELRFRDSNIKSVEIDNLTVTTIPVPPAVWLFGSALGLLGWMKHRAA